MARSKGSRVFMVYAADIDINMYYKVTLRQDDIIVVFMDETIDIPDTFWELNGRFVKIEKPVNTYNTLQVLKEINDPQISAYFCGESMSHIFEKAKDDIIKYCNRALAHNTLGVSKIPAGAYYKKQKMEDEQLDMLAAFGSAILEAKVESISTTDKPKESNNTQENVSINNENSVSPKEQTKEESRNIKTHPKTLKQDPPRETVNLKEMEDAISGNGHQDSTNLFLAYTKLDQAKNTLIALLMERFGEHANRIAKENLPWKEIYDLSKLILKTEKADDFNDSYKTMYPHTAVYLSDRGFTILKTEAEFITDISIKLYEEDVFND